MRATEVAVRLAILVERAKLNVSEYYPLIRGHLQLPFGAVIISDRTAIVFIYRIPFSLFLTQVARGATHHGWVAPMYLLYLC